MLNDKYGGRKAIREVIRSGKLVEVLLGQTAREERAEIPKKKATDRAKKAHARAKYYGRMASVLREAGFSAALSEEVKRRRLLRIFSQRVEIHEAGDTAAVHTTHLWSQHHLRQAGLPLPEVQWPGQEGKGGKGSKGGKGGKGGQEGKGRAWLTPWWSNSQDWWGNASSGSWWGRSSSSGRPW